MPDYDDLHHAELPALNEGISQGARMKEDPREVCTALMALSYARASREPLAPQVIGHNHVNEAARHPLKEMQAAE
jgi:hypothetical protein